MSTKKRIPDKIFVQWHSTGNTLHQPSLSKLGEPHRKTCKICHVNYRIGDEYGCQGVDFDSWLKQEGYEKWLK